jgi:hypothetical protein
MRRDGMARTYQAMRRAQRALETQLRREREAADEALDRALIAESRADDGESIPWEEVKLELGLNGAARQPAGRRARA